MRYHPSSSRNSRALPVALGLFLGGTAIPISGCLGEFGTGDPATETITSALDVGSFHGWTQIPNGLFISGPAASAKNVNTAVTTMEVCGQGMDDRIWCALWSSQLEWSPFSPLGTKTFTGRPGMTSWTDSAGRPQLAVVANTPSGETMINITQSNVLGDFVGWSTIPGSGPFSLPVAIASQGNKLHVFGVKADRRMYFASNDVSSGVFNNAGWSTWREVPGGGLFNAAPAATRLNDAGTLALAGRGLDNRFWVAEGTAPASMTGWHQIPSSEQTVAPCITSREDNLVDLFGAFPGDNRVRVTTINPGFSPPGAIFDIIPNGLLDTPAAVALRSSVKLDLVARGLDKAFWINRYF